MFRGILWGVWGDTLICLGEYLGCLEGFFGDCWGIFWGVWGDTLGYLQGVLGNIWGVWRDNLGCFGDTLGCLGGNFDLSWFLGGYLVVYGGLL